MSFGTHHFLTLSDLPSCLKKLLFPESKMWTVCSKKQAISEVTTENYGQVWVVEGSATCFTSSFVSGFFTTASGPFLGGTSGSSGPLSSS